MSTPMPKMVLALLLFILALQSSYGKEWCIADPNSGEQMLQGGLDWACANGADCSKTLPGQPCFLPDSLLGHASYAYNSYYKKFQGVGATCSFKYTAKFTDVDPSHGDCVFD